MDIFYLKKSEFLPNIDPNSLKKFSDGRIFKSKDKEEEHLLGIFLTKFIAKYIYDIKNPEIIIKKFHSVWTSFGASFLKSQKHAENNN